MEINGKKISGATTRGYKKRVKRLREGNRKRGRVNKAVHEPTRGPSIVFTEDLEEKPREEMAKKHNRELRHRVKHIPIKAVVEEVRDGARGVEVGSRVGGTPGSPPYTAWPSPGGRSWGAAQEATGCAEMWRPSSEAAEGLEPRRAEMVRRAPSAVDEKTLEWTKTALEAEGGQTSRPAAPARASTTTPPAEAGAGRGHQRAAPRRTPRGGEEVRHHCT